MRYLMRLWPLILLVMVSACGHHQKQAIDTSYSNEDLVALQGPILALIQEEGLFAAHGCGTQKHEDGYWYLVIDANEEGDVDYEAYKWHIREVLDAYVPMAFDLIPFPESPTIQGLVHEIELRDLGETHILLVSDQEFLSDGSPNAMDIRISSSTTIVDDQGNPYDLEDLKVGMTAASYYRGNTLTTYPGQQGCEKLVVKPSAPTSKLKDTIDDQLFRTKYDGEDLLGPLPIIGKGWRRSNLVDEAGLRLVELSLTQGVEFYKHDFSTLDSYAYEGELLAYVRDAKTYKTNPFNLGTTYISEDFDPIYKDDDGDGLLDLQIPFYEDGVWTDRMFSLTEDGLMFRNDGDSGLKLGLVRYLSEQGYGIYQDLGRQETYLLTKERLTSMPYSQVWGLQTLQVADYLNKEISHEHFVVTNHALSGLSPQGRTHVWLMVCEGQMIGGYAYPDDQPAIYGAVYTLDGRTLEEVTGLDYKTWLDQWTDQVEGMKRQVPRPDQLEEDVLLDKNAYGQVAYPLFASIPEEGIYLYEDEEGALLKHHDQVQYFPWVLTTPRFILPRLKMMDLNQDGKEELICVNYIGSGTGVSVEELHVLTLEDDVYVDHVYHAMEAQLEEVFHWAWQEPGQVIALSINEETTEMPLTDEMLTYGVQDLKANTAIIGYDIEADQVILIMPMMALSDEAPMGLYTFYSFRAVVDFDGQTFQLKNVTLEKEKF